MDNQVKQKKRRALLAYVSEEPDGLRVVLDDMVAKQGEPNTWLREGLFASKVYAEKEFEELTMNQQELADFGFHVLARLNAAWKIAKAKD